MALLPHPPHIYPQDTATARPGLPAGEQSVEGERGGAAAVSTGGYIRSGDEGRHTCSLLAAAMAAFASAYGTFLTMLPSSPPDSTTGMRWGWANGFSSSPMDGGGGGSDITSSGSCPVAYRCLLLLDEGGQGVMGLRLGWVGGLLRVTAVLSASVKRLCQVCEGDVVTHIDEESVQQQLSGPEPPLALLQSILRRCPHSPSTASAPSNPQWRAVVELRLIRARTLQQHLFSFSDNSTSPSPSLAAAGSSASYTQLQRAAGPVLLYEAHARDTLSSIAVRFRTTAQELRARNREVFPPGEPGPPCVQPGLLLLVRDPDWDDGSLLLPVTPERRPAIEGVGTATSSLPSPLSTATTTGLRRRREHMLVEGETLEGVARAYGVGVMEIRAWNREMFPVGEPGLAVAGDRLVVFVREAEVGGDRGRRSRGRMGQGEDEQLTDRTDQAFDEHATLATANW